MAGKKSAVAEVEPTASPRLLPSKMTKPIPSLDGLRAIAITFVVSAHAVQRGAPMISARAATYLTVLAYTGIKIFFVLSGFLITSLLLKEFQETGTLSVRRFYWLRTLRIFPAMYAFLFLVGIGHASGIVSTGQDGPLRILSAATYVSDYVPVWGWPLHHTWPLSVEEQFYLLWPAALLVCGLSKAAIFRVILIVVAIVSRTVAYGEYRFDTVADSFAVGCLASIHRKPVEKFLLRAWPRSIPMATLLLLPIILLPAANHYSRRPTFSSLVGIPLLNLAVGIAMLAVIVRPPSWLNAGPLIAVSAPWVRDFRSGWLWLPASLLCAWLSYRFVEQPVLRWRDQLSHSKAHGLTNIPHE